MNVDAETLASIAQKATSFDDALNALSDHLVDQSDQRPLMGLTNAETTARDNRAVVHGEAPGAWRDRMATALVDGLTGKRERGTEPLTVSRLAFEVCARAGLKPFDAADAISMAQHSTSDFSAILESALGNRVARAIEQAQPAIARLSTPIDREDYRQARQVELGSAPTPELVPEGGEIKHITLAENGEALPTVADFASIFSISNQALVNDASAARAFDSLAQKMTRGAVERLRQVLLAPVIGPSGYGQLMADGAPVFDAARGNLATAGEAPSLTALAAAVAAMRRQRGIGGELLALEPKYILTGPENEILCLRLVETLAATEVENANPLARRFEVVVEPGITDARWFVAAAPTQAIGLAHSFLLGQAAPRIETKLGWGTLNTEWRLHWPLGAAFLEPRAWIMNEGDSGGTG